MLLFVLLAVADPALLRREIATVALAQARKPDPAWHPDQRDCAGLVRFAYRSAYARFDHTKLPLWRAKGASTGFADAETLLQESFVSLGRDETAERAAETGDLVAFRDEDEQTFHLMLYVRGEDRARTDALVVYSPGNGTSEVRVGRFAALKIDAPHEWRPLASNQRFLGFYRFKELTHGGR